MFFSSVLVAVFSVLLYQESSWRYYFYAAFPIYFWEEVIARRKALSAGRAILLGHVRSFKGYLGLGIQIAIFLGVLEALVQSYFHREILTLCFVLGAFWPVAYGTKFLGSHALLSAAWAIGCCLMSTFTLLPVLKIESITTM